MSNENKCVLYLNVPRDIKAHFHAWCAKRGKTMTAELIEFMRQTIRAESKPSRS